MVKYCLAKFCRTADAGFCRKVLCGETAAKSDCRHQNQDSKTADDVRTVIAGDTHIDDLGNNHRHQKVEYDFQKLEQRSNDALFFVVLQVDSKTFHLLFHSPFLCFFNAITDRSVFCTPQSWHLDIDSIISYD